MKLDTANRAFATLVAVAIAPYVLLGVFGCGLLSYLVYRVADDGPAVLTAEADLRPAALFFAVVSAGTVLAARSLWQQHRATRRLAAHVRDDAVAVPSELEAASHRTGLAGSVDVVDSTEPWSFTYGLRSPRVAVSSRLAMSATPEELDAVLAHERYHVRNRDPLKIVVARAVPPAFFFLPALGHLRARYQTGRELAADRGALRATGRRPLAAALYRVVAGPGWPELSTAAAIGGEDLLDVRLTQLETGEEPTLDRIPRPALATTVLGLVLLLAALAATVVAVGGPGELMDMDMNREMGVEVRSFSIAGGVACGVAWLTGGVLVYRVLARRRS